MRLEYPIIALLLVTSSLVVSVQIAHRTHASTFTFSFAENATLEESDTMDGSSSPYWWLDSGARLIIHNGVGATVSGDLSSGDPWYIEYARTNSSDSDNGTHPQNIFRLLTKTQWNNVREEMFFKILKDNLSQSPNRNESNGLLLMSRCTSDGQTLYYAGIRVDGTAIIKKKLNGTYYSLAQNQVFPGTYDASSSPDLLPHNEWIGLRAETVTNTDGSVDVRLYMQDTNGLWNLLLSAHDDGSFENSPPIVGSNYIGIRTDFMDVQFENFRAQEISS